MGFLYPNQFWRLREMSVVWNLPKRLVSYVRAPNAELTFAARNLHVWSRYKGPDPEGTYTDADVPSSYSTSGQRTYFNVRFNIHY